MSKIRDNDSLGTPDSVLDLVRSMSVIALDPCSNPWSRVGAIHECSLHDRCDGLIDPWSLAKDEGCAFVNPPYSDPMWWARMGVQAARDGMEVFLLLKHDPSTRYSALLREHAQARCDFHKRIEFVGGKHRTGAMASTLWYLGHRRYLFAHTFEGVGEVRVYG